MYKAAVIIAVAIIFANAAFALSGSGTEADPWRIQSLADFNEFAADPAYWDDYSRLETDVNLAGPIYTTAVIAPDLDRAEARFQGTAFTGIFDGNGHKVIHLRVDDRGTNNDYLGLIGYIDGGQVRNLGLEDVSIRGRAWSIYVGAIVGDTEDSILWNCYSTGKVTGGASVGGLMGDNGGCVSNCYSDADVNGARGVHGGLLARNNGMVLNCYATGNVTASAGSVGGLVAINHFGSIWNCYATGNVTGDDSVGGLVGFNGRIISNCYSTGDVSGAEDVGGLVGVSQGCVVNCFWNIETQNHGVTESIGYAYPHGTAVNIAGLPTAQMQIESTFAFAGWDFIGESANGTSETWRMPTSGGCPVLSFFRSEMPFSLSGSGTTEAPYLISDANELGMIRWFPVDCCFKLTSDIDLLGITWSVPVTPVFHGSFEGGGHKLVNMQMSGGDFLGLFGHLGSSGQARNVGLESVFVAGNNYIGSLVGSNRGRVSGCYSTGSIGGEDWVGGLTGENDKGSVSDCHSSSDVEGSAYIGGIVGLNRGSISKCYSSGDVRGGDRVGGIAGNNSEILSACYSTNDVVGEDDYAGGLLGENLGVVCGCYATGEVAGRNGVGGLVGFNREGSVSNCYSIGDVNASGRWRGGLAGRNDRGVWFDCFWDADMQTHGTGASIGSDTAGTEWNIAGLSTTRMQSKDTFISAGWDFIDESAKGTGESWQMPSGGGYPVLSFFHSEIPIPLAGNGTADVPYLIDDPNGLGMVNWYPEESCFRLATDIDLSGIDWSVAVVPTFNGVFDAAGHKIINMEISGGGYLALFGYVGEHGQIKEVGVESSSVSGMRRYVAGLVGRNRGSISDCFYRGDVTGNGYVGGLAGYSEGSVSKCSAVGDVNAVSSVGGLLGYNDGQVTTCYSSSYVAGESGVGGLVGADNWNSDITDCYSTCDVIGVGAGAVVGGLVGSLEGSVSKCYSACNVRGSRMVGGLVGRVFFTGTLSNCFWDTNMRSCQELPSIGRIEHGATGSGVIGMSTDDMARKSTFTSKGWDFVGIWDLTCEGIDYPRFLWQILPTDFVCPHGVDMIDYSHFSRYWLDDGCGDPNDHCNGADLDLSGGVGPSDLHVIAESWLQQKRASGCPRGLFEPATCPDPPAMAARVSIDLVLNWHAGCGSLSHDVYFGTTSPGTFQGNQTETTFEPGPLEYDQTYYWRIDEKNAHDTTTGPVWTFRTKDGGS